MKTNILDLTQSELSKKIDSMSEAGYKAHQIWNWLYRKNSSSFSAMKNLSEELVKKLSKEFDIKKPKLVKHLTSADGTEKFLWKLTDSSLVESVLIKEGKRRTLCISTQVGCKFACSFCRSGMKGFFRNMSPSEITGQLLGVEEERITNIVFMGMGEPLDNFENVKKSIQIMNDPKGIALGARKMTVSTCGIVPGILKLKDIGVQVELAVSLHATTDEVRNELVPVNRKYNLKSLEEACREYYEATGRVITLEYALIRGRNDSLKEAERLARIAKRLKAKVNLIRCSPVEGGSVSPEEGKIQAFRKRLLLKKTNVTLRRSKGSDILAACGQLAFEKEK